MPDIPREAWCDFRKDFVEKNMTLIQLAQKYCCDPRTVRNCIQHNKSSFELGKKSTPTHMQLYEQQVRELILHNIDIINHLAQIFTSICRYDWISDALLSSPTHVLTSLWGNI